MFLPRSLIPLLPPSLLVVLELSAIAVATTTFTIQPNDTRSTISHCGPDCDVAYTVVSVTWEPTISTIPVLGNANSVAWSQSMYSEYYAQFSPQLVDGTVATDWRIPDFTATCCDDAWYINSGVTAQYETETGENCLPTDAVFTGIRVGALQHAVPTDLPFLQHDCEVSTTIVKTVFTRITIMAAPPNPPTATADGQSTWWEDGSNQITIQLPPTPTPFFTISKCEFFGASSCSWSLGTMNLRWEQSTITITGDASELSSLEYEIVTSIENREDWLNATAGWASVLGTSATCCSESVWLDNSVTINYGGWCPTTVLTGYNTILPLSIAWSFIDGDEADCRLNIGGGIASTKTAIYIEKVTADIRPPTTTSPPPATKEPDTVPTSTTSSVLTKETEVVDSSSRTTPRTTPRTTGRTTPRTTTTRRFTTMSSRQAQPVQSSQSPSGPPVDPPSSSQGPVNPSDTQPNNPPNTQPNNPLNTQPNNLPNTQSNNPPNTDPNNPPNTNNPPSNPSQEPTGLNNLPQTSSPPNEGPGTPVIPGTPAPEPSISTIFTSIPTIITTTNDLGVETTITTFTSTPISTALNVITTDDEGNTITTRITFSNPSITALPADGNNTTDEPVPESQDPVVPGVTSRTTILTLTSRIGSGITVETRTSIIAESMPGPGTTPITEDEPGSGTETQLSGPEPTGPSSDAVSHRSQSLGLAIAASFLVSIFYLS
ncbi:hypothetical protein TWF730_008875 [Orbilia blumenaviensis]|uniref:Uncharacterized protein n=1 Tax=Orbilia blumenaviensis TaxID=1796055 RepID=A0AAV9V611_9PEZI